MRWSHLVLPCVLGFSAVGLVACFDKDNKTSVKSAAAPQNPARSSTPLQQSQTPVTPEEQQRRSSMNGNQLCYADLCRPGVVELSLPQILQKASQGSPPQQQYYAQYIKPTLEKGTSTRIELLKAFQGLLEKNENSFEDLHLDKTQLRFMKAFLFAVGSDLIDSDVRKKLNEEFKATALAKVYGMATVLGPRDYLENLYKGASLAEAARKEIKIIELLRDKLNIGVKANLIQADSLSLTTVRSGVEPDLEEMKQIMNDSYFMRLMSWLTNDKNSQVDLINIDEDMLKDLYFNANLSKTMKDDIENTQNSAAECEQTYYRALTLYPQTSDLDIFRKTAESVRQETLSLLGENDPAYQIVKETEFHFPMDANKVSGYWLKQLQSDSESDKRSLELTRNYNAETTMIMAMVLSARYPGRKNFCQNLIDLQISDKSLSLGEKHSVDAGIKISWFSVKYPAYGAGIVAHELGHVVSQNSSQYDHQKQCLANKQSNQYMEEDIADFIAAKVSVRLQNQMKQGNFGCILASTEETSDSSNAFNQRQQFSLSPDPNDVHSSGLYRALQIAMNRKENIPVTCKALADHQAPKTLISCE